MGKLVARFKQLSRWSATPLGFRPSSSETQRPQMILLANVTALTDDDVQTLSESKVDAVMISGEPGVRKLTGLVKMLGDIPAGLYLNDDDPGAIDAAIKAGCDFAVLNPKSPSEMLKREGLSRIVEVERSFDQGMVRVIDELPISIDAVFYGETSEDPAVSMEQLLFCQKIIESVNKPFVLAISAPLSPDQINVLWQVGVDALSVFTQDLDALADIRKAIDALPKENHRKKKSGATPILPRAPAAASELQDDEEEEYL